MTAPDAALRRFADEVGDTGPVAVEGHRTRWEAGGTLASGTRVLRAPAGIVEHRHEEMTVRVRVGTPVAELHRELGATGQRTALPDRGGTVGGALAVGEDDVRVLGRGRVRDAVLQVRYVSSGGEVVSGGGPTVKNVTGYDLPRLMVGSLGTLGVLAEVVLRTNPVPRVSSWVTAGRADPFAAFAALARPSPVLWDGHRTWVLLEGHAADVDAERADLDAVAPCGEAWELADGPPELPPHRWSFRPSELRNLDSAALGAFVASVGVGTVCASCPPPARRLPSAVVTLNRRVKEEFDPDGRLNPGRRVVPAP